MGLQPEKIAGFFTFFAEIVIQKLD